MYKNKLTLSFILSQIVFCLLLAGHLYNIASTFQLKLQANGALLSGPVIQEGFGSDLQASRASWPSQKDLILLGNSGQEPEPFISPLGGSLQRLDAPAAILYAPQLDALIWQRDAYKPRPAASMTKLMSAYLASEYLAEQGLSGEELLKISYDGSAAARPFDASVAYLREGMELSWNELLAQLIIGSANDAAYSLAIAVAGSVEDFVGQMNAKAAAMGLEDQMRFVDPDGWDAGNLISPYAMSQLAAKYIEDFPENLVKWHSKPELAIPWSARAVKRNTNLLLSLFQGVDGLKTGFTYAAGFNFCATAEQKQGGQDLRLISVVMGIEDTNISRGLQRRAEQAAALLDWGYRHLSYFANPRWQLRYSLGREAGAKSLELSAAPEMNTWLWQDEPRSKGLATKQEAAQAGEEGSLRNYEFLVQIRSSDLSKALLLYSPSLFATMGRAAIDDANLAAAGKKLHIGSISLIKNQELLGRSLLGLTPQEGASNLGAWDRLSYLLLAYSSTWFWPEGQEYRWQGSVGEHGVENEQ